MAKASTLIRYSIAGSKMTDTEESLVGIYGEGSSILSLDPNENKPVEDPEPV